VLRYFSRNRQRYPSANASIAKVKTGLAVSGIITADAVMLFMSSLRCGVSGASASHA